jgi:hypothetical protein
MSGQTTYEDTPAIGFPGLLAEPFSLNQVDSGLVEAPAGIVAGTAVAPGTAEGQYIPAVADGAVYGVTAFAHTPQENQDGNFTYEDKTQFPVLSKGRIWMTANAAIAKGTVLGYDPATGKVGPVVGTVTTLAFATAQTAAAADGDLIMIEVDF